MDLQLKGKRALVTGGSRGIGRAITLSLLRQGVEVVACYRQESDAVESLKKEIAEIGTGYLVQADVSQADEVTRLIEECNTRLGGLDIVVNNAGIMNQVPYKDLPLAEWQSLLNTNLTAVYLVIQAALPLLSTGASVINVGSGLAMRGIPARAHYTASKAGVVGLTRSLCKELGGQGIRVNTVAPGIVETDLAPEMTTEQRKRYEAMTAFGRPAKPEDVANVVLFLASNLAGFVSGVTLNVDGGI
jgi:NAD(P)-dependent dehydrogenase (short-subunit alcohol dehydrogenase family)